MKVKFVDLGTQYLKFRSAILQKFDDISSQGSYILSGELESFENSFAEYCEVKYALGVGNGTDALALLLRAFGVGPGDEVITVPNSFIATAGAIASLGAKVVFVDVGDDFNINSNLIPNAVTDHTKAIVPVHLTGRIADMDSILAVGEQYSLAIIEDAAQAVGACYKSKRAGSFGLGASFSLHPLKNLHVHGDGGVITTNDLKLYEKMKQMRNHGLKSRDECTFWGVNSRLDAIQAAIAMIKLPYLDTLNARHRQIADKYSSALQDYVKVPELASWEECIYHRYMICTEQRDDLQEYLERAGIETKVNYPVPIHLQETANNLGYKRGDFPMCEKLSKTILSLPVYAELQDVQIDYVIGKIKEFFNETTNHKKSEQNTSKDKVAVL